jgi:hypothetical protein
VVLADRQLLADEGVRVSVDRRDVLQRIGGLRVRKRTIIEKMGMNK